jgi:deoxyribonuclease (pyrimidine dimer)
MTRIDPIRHDQVSILNDKHLGSAWNEVPRIITEVEKLIESGRTVTIPERFTFNGGHMKFFYNKIEFIEDRLAALFLESTKRGFNWDYHKYDNYLRRCHLIREMHPEFYNDWEPTQDEIYLGMARLISRKFKTKMAVVGREIIE